jgi:Ca-activated chloride channel family protein
MRFSLFGVIFSAIFSFAIPLYLKKKGETLLFSHIPQKVPSPHSPPFPLPKWLNAIAVAFLLLAMSDPHGTQTLSVAPQEPMEGVALFLALDHSGSMQYEISPGVDRLEALKEVSIAFIEKRKSDLVGALQFARGAQVLSPLTFDHEGIILKIQALEVVKDPEQEGTAIGYALYKAAAMLSQTATYSKEKGFPIKSKAIILVTDGLEKPSPLDQGKKLPNLGILQASQFAKSQGIRVYLVNVDPNFATNAQALNRKQMEEAVELTGGKLFVVGPRSGLEQIFSQIDSLEKSPLLSLTAVQKRTFSLYPYLIGIALVLFAVSLVLKRTLYWGVP